MLITCQKCATQYEVDAALIPPTGVMMRCPACLHTFPVKPEPIVLHEQEDAFTPPEGIKPPPPRRPGPAAAGPGPAPGPGPGPGARPGQGPAPAPGPGEAELPVPKRAPDRLAGVAGPPDASRRTEAADLPAPKRPGRSPGTPPALADRQIDPLLDLDIPPPPGAPVMILSPEPDPPAPAAPQRQGGEEDLPAPVGPRPREISDLPAPVYGAGPRPGPGQARAPQAPPTTSDPWASGASVRFSDLPAPVAPDLPGPRQAPQAQARQAPQAGPRASSLTDLPAPVAPDLLSPVMPPSELPSPVPAGLPAPVRPDLVQPLRSSPISGQINPTSQPGRLDRSTRHRSPEDEELNLDGLDIPPPPLPLTPAGRSSRPGAGPGAAPAPAPASILGDLGGIEDLALPEPEPRSAPASSLRSGPPLMSRESNDLEPPTRPILTGLRSDEPAPEAESEEPVSQDLLSKVAETQAQRQAAAAAAAAAPAAPEKPKKEMTRRRKILIFGGAALGALLLIGGGLTAFLLLRGGRTPEAQAQINEAQKLLLEDMLPSYRKAAEKLAAVAAQDDQDVEALALEAQARLSAARHGVAAESQKADALLRRIPQERQGEVEPAKAKALKDLVAGKAKEAARALTPLAKGAVARKDPFPALYQGWAELRAGDYAAAEKAFRASLALRPKTAAALLGVAQAKEKAGDRKAAHTAYREALGVAPAHFGAAMGKIRTGDDPAGEAQLLDLLAKRQANAAPRELADAWAILGARALDLSRRKDAEDRLRRAMAADPTNVPARVSLAGLLCDDNKIQEATELARRTYKDDPKNPEAALVLVRALLTGKKPLDAGPPLEALVKMAPKDPRVLYWQGRREEEVAAQGSDARAAALYRQAIEINPRYLDAYIALSRVLGRQGETTEALASLRQVASQAQGDPLLATSMAEAYLSMGEAARAEEAFRLALAKKPEMHHARLSLAQALESQGKLGEAVAELEELQKRSNGYPGLNERRAQLLIKQERFGDAEAAYLAAAAETGASVEVRLDAASFTLRGHAQEAKAILEGVIKESPRNQRAFALMAQLLLLQGQVPEAAVRAETAAKLGDSPEVHLARGMVLLQQNKRADAEQALALARKAPTEGRAMLLHARLLADDGRVEDALRELQDLIGRGKALLADRMVYRPEEAREILGNAYLQQADLEVLLGRPEKAAPAYEQATRLLPKSGEAAARYGKVLYQMDKRKPAIVQFNRAIQLGGDSAPYALETYLTLGDCHREGRQRAEAIRAYQKWLSLAPALAPERKEVERHVQSLAEGRRH